MTEGRPAMPATGIETHGIDYIPVSERHGKVGDQGVFWFTGNFQFFTISIGFIGPSIGLSFGWTALAGIAGSAFGALFMAAHATQGPILGLPQMIQSRAQFGSRGVIIPLVATLINCTAQSAVCAFLISRGLSAVFGVPTSVTLTASAIVTACLAIYGYDWIHRVFRLLFWVSLPAFTILTGAILTGSLQGSEAPHAAGFSGVGFAMQFAACASYNIAYAPFISDYTRYLPESVRRGRLILSVLIGASVSASWLVVLGAWLASHFQISDPLRALEASGEMLVPGFGKFLAIDSVLVVAAGMALAEYSGMLTLLTIADGIAAVKPAARSRIIGVIAMTLVWLAIASLGGSDVVDFLVLALTIILYALSPWTAINLVDFFLVRRGHYDIPELFKQHGVYGTWSLPGIAAFAAGVVAIVPFAVLPGLWIAPFGRMLEGIDVAWIVGMAVSGLAYLLLARARRLAPFEVRQVAPAE